MVSLLTSPAQVSASDPLRHPQGTWMSEEVIVEGNCSGQSPGPRLHTGFPPLPKPRPWHLVLESGMGSFTSPSLCVLVCWRMQMVTGKRRW